jgi:hypothetical protein
MTKSLDPFPVLLIAVPGWMNQQQLQLIDYLREENRVLREQLAKSDYASTMTSAADWPPRPRDWEESFSERWLRSASASGIGSLLRFLAPTSML